MPTLEEIKKATVTGTFAYESDSLSGSIEFDSALQTSPGICSTTWVTRNSDGSAEWYGIVAVYEAGQHIVIKDGYEIPIEVPQTGLYVAVDDEIHMIIEKNPVLQYTFDIVWESVKTIEPKYLPGVCPPVVDLTGYTPGEIITDKTLIAHLNELREAATPALIVKANVSGAVIYCICSFLIMESISMGWITTVHNGFSWYSIGVAIDPNAYPNIEWFFNVQEV
jgi:hypothetical protein